MDVGRLIATYNRAFRMGVISREELDFYLRDIYERYADQEEEPCESSAQSAQSPE